MMRPRPTRACAHAREALPPTRARGSSDRLMMALALTVRLGSFDALPMAGTRRGDGERDGLGARQRTRAFGSWAPFEPHISRAGMDYGKPRCARITLDALTRVLIGWRRYCDPGLRAARPS